MPLEFNAKPQLTSCIYCFFYNISILACQEFRTPMLYGIDPGGVDAVWRFYHLSHYTNPGTPNSWLGIVMRTASMHCRLRWSMYEPWRAQRLGMTPLIAHNYFWFSSQKASFIERKGINMVSFPFMKRSDILTIHFAILAVRNKPPKSHLIQHGFDLVPIYQWPHPRPWWQGIAGTHYWVLWSFRKCRCRQNGQYGGWWLSHERHP